MLTHRVQHYTISRGKCYACQLFLSSKITASVKPDRSSWPTCDMCQVKAYVYPIMMSQFTRHGNSDSNFPTLRVGCLPSSYPTSAPANNPTRRNRLQITRHVGSTYPTSKVYIGQVTQRRLSASKNLCYALICPDGVVLRARWTFDGQLA